MATGWRIVAQASNLDAPGTDQDFLAASEGAAAAGLEEEFASGGRIQIQKGYFGWTLRINICCAGNSKVKVVDETGVEIFLNGGSPLNAGQNYLEDFIPDPDRTYNLQLDTTDGAIRHLSIIAAEGYSV